MVRWQGATQGDRDSRPVGEHRGLGGGEIKTVIGLEPGMVRLFPYQEAWSHLFAQEKKRIVKAVGPYILDIQHVGSTAIPGMPAKPIIDIGVAVKNFEEAGVCIPHIESLGYEYAGENGIPRRHYFRKGHPRTHHLHMNEVDSEDWINQIRFRDYLRAHSEAAQAYAHLKIELAQQFPTDREQYLVGKSLFVAQILRLAIREERQSPC